MEKSKLQASLEQKLGKENQSFTQVELDWLLENIGHPNPDIRDRLVYLLFVQGLQNQWFTKEQFAYLAEFSHKNDLILSGSMTSLKDALTRTFAALLNVVLLYGDSGEDFSYQGIMTNDQKDYFFQAAIQYLKKEEVFTGYSQEFGWVHGFAHGADFLQTSLAHRDFPIERIPDVFESLRQVFYRMPQAFVAREERRLAKVLITGLTSGKISQQEVADWLMTFSFQTKELVDFDRQAAFEVFLAAVYFGVFEEISLEPQLKEEMFKWLRNFSN